VQALVARAEGGPGAGSGIKLDHDALEAGGNLARGQGQGGGDGRIRPARDEQTEKLQLSRGQPVQVARPDSSTTTSA
jgi:hypothetical protein